MEQRGDEVHFETDEARGASTPNIVRWILAISLLAAIVLLSLIWMTGAATQRDDEDEVSVTSMAADPPGGGADEVASEEATELDAADPGEDNVTPTVENEAADEPAEEVPAAE